MTWFPGIISSASSRFQYSDRLNEKRRVKARERVFPWDPPGARGRPGSLLFGGHLLPSELMSSEQQSQEGHPRSAAYGSAKRSPLCFWFFWSICKIASDLFSWHVVSHGSSETPRIRDAGDGVLSPSRVPCGLAQQARVGWWQSSGKHRFSWFSQPVFWFVKMCAKATGSPAYVLLCSEATFIVSN